MNITLDTGLTWQGSLALLSDTGVQPSKLVSWGYIINQGRKRWSFCVGIYRGTGGCIAYRRIGSVFLFVSH